MSTSSPATVPPPSRSPCPIASEHFARSPENDRSALKMPPLDSNLVSLCDHILLEGFNSGAFSDVMVQAMGTTYHLHRLILSRSSYFRNMLHGPWKEAGAPTIVLHIDDANINTEAIMTSLAYLYGHLPELNDSNASRVLAAASFLDLQDLCAICTDFIIAELRTSNFLSYQIFAEGQDYGVHGEHVRNACWGYLCQSAAKELREVLPKLSSQTLHALLTSDELWVLDDEKRFELALYILLAKITVNVGDTHLQQSLGYELEPRIDSSVTNGKSSTDRMLETHVMESHLQCLSMQDELEEHTTAHNILVELADCAVDFCTDVKIQIRENTSSQELRDQEAYQIKMEESTPVISTIGSNANVVTLTCMNLPNIIDARKMETNDAAAEGPSGESSCSQLINGVWVPSREPCYSSRRIASSEWGRCNIPSIWGGRVVGSGCVKGAKGEWGVGYEDYDTFANIFEGGSILYCNMSFEMLLSVRKQLEELGFPCKALNDGLWLQMLLSHRVQAICADTCKNCCLTSEACACRRLYGKENDRSNHPSCASNVFVANAQGEGGLFGTGRVHARGTIDGLAGIGRQTTGGSAATWPPTRYVFSRVPIGLGNRSGQQSLGKDESEARAECSGESVGDGLTAVVSLSQGNNVAFLQPEQISRMYESEQRNGYSGASYRPRSGELPLQILEPQEHGVGLDMESSEGSSISLDMKTPLRHFPPFRFGVEFEDVHRLTDGQVKHSPEAFYAGSLWKISIQAFGDEDPQGRRTLGLFLHRRKAEVPDPVRKVHVYVDTREKVTARYQLVCPSKREVMVFGSFKQAGTLLPKAPKGWGWRTALLFDELGDLLQGQSLRVAAIVQLV